jgi:hypothetical protein
MSVEVLGLISGKEDDGTYETGRLVRNWAETFECRPERLYSPVSEEQVAEVSLSEADADLDCESCEGTWEDYSMCWCCSFAV